MILSSSSITSMTAMARNRDASNPTPLIPRSSQRAACTSLPLPSGELVIDRVVKRKGARGNSRMLKVPTFSGGSWRLAVSASSKESEGQAEMDDSPVMKYALQPNSSETKEAQQRDYDGYFSSYAYLYHQKEMLQDQQRMQAYYRGIMSQKNAINEKMVLDVGAGTAILSLWAAQAGAKKVWAVEYTDIARYAEKLCKANDPRGVVSVIQSSAEQIMMMIIIAVLLSVDNNDNNDDDDDDDDDENDGIALLELREDVDVIVSEWMGTVKVGMFLLRESMLDSLIRVRDRYLKPDGIVLPSHAKMYWGVVSAEGERQRIREELNDALGAWKPFTSTLKETYGVDYGVLTGDYVDEQNEYYIRHSRWCQLEEDDMISDGALVKSIDVKTVTLAEARGVEKTAFTLHILRDANATGFAGWFTTLFDPNADHNDKKTEPRVVYDNGSKNDDFNDDEYHNDGDYEDCDDIDDYDDDVILSTAPNAGPTHWGQQYFPFQKVATRRPIDLKEGDVVEGTMEMFRSNKTYRTYKVLSSWYIKRASGDKTKNTTVLWHLE
eukprot:jgi/Bigna1/126218/aug1.2_g926